MHRICVWLEVRLYSAGQLRGVIKNKTRSQLLEAMDRWCIRKDTPGLLIAQLWDARRNRERERRMGAGCERSKDV